MGNKNFINTDIFSLDTTDFETTEQSKICGLKGLDASVEYNTICAQFVRDNDYLLFLHSDYSLDEGVGIYLIRDAAILDHIDFGEIGVNDTPKDFKVNRNSIDFSFPSEMRWRVKCHKHYRFIMTSVYVLGQFWSTKNLLFGWLSINRIK